MTRALWNARKRARPWRVLEIVLWAITGVLLLYRITPELRAAAGLPATEALAPVVAFDMLDGTSVSLKQLHGQVVLVNFWATWCPPCRNEVGGFQNVYEARRAEGFTVIGLTAADESPRRIETFRAERHLSYPVGVATVRTEAAFGGVNGFPTSFLIDRNGRVRYTVRGIFAEAALSEAVDRLLAESE